MATPLDPNKRPAAEGSTSAPANTSTDSQPAASSSVGLGISSSQLAGMDPTAAAQQVVGGALARTGSSASGPADSGLLHRDPQLEAQMAAYEKAHPEAVDALKQAVEQAIGTASASGLGSQMMAQTGALRALNARVTDARAQLAAATGAPEKARLSEQLSDLAEQQQLQQVKLSETAAQYQQAQDRAGIPYTQQDDAQTPSTSTSSPSGGAGLRAQMIEQRDTLKTLTPGGDEAQMVQNQLAQTTAKYATALLQAGLPYTTP